MNLYDFKKLVLEKKLSGLYVISGVEYFLKNQYIERISKDYGLVKVNSFEELKNKLGRKTLSGKKLNNLLLYIETIDKIDLKEIKNKIGDGVVLIVSVDDINKKDIIYFDKCDRAILKKYTDSPYLDYRGQIEIVHNALEILGLQEKDILTVGLAENKLKEPNSIDYAIAVIVGDRDTLIMYNFILKQLNVSPYIYIITLIELLEIYYLFIKNNNVFDGTNEAFKMGLNYGYAKQLRDSFCRKKTEEEKENNPYGNWVTLRSIHYVDCKKVKDELMELLLNNYMYYDIEDIYNYMTFCL